MFHNYAHSFLTQLPHTYYHDGDNTLLEIFYMPPQSEDHALNASFLVSWEFSHPFFTSSLNFLSMTPVHWHSSSTLLPLMEKQSTSSRLLFLLRPQQSHSLAWIYFFLILLLHFFFQVLTFFKHHYHLLSPLFWLYLKLLFSLSLTSASYSSLLSL